MFSSSLPSLNRFSPLSFSSWHPVLVLVSVPPQVTSSVPRASIAVYILVTPKCRCPAWTSFWSSIFAYLARVSTCSKLTALLCQAVFWIPPQDDQQHYPQSLKSCGNSSWTPSSQVRFICPLRFVLSCSVPPSLTAFVQVFRCLLFGFELLPFIPSFLEWFSYIPLIWKTRQWLLVAWRIDSLLLCLVQGSPGSDL